MGIADRIFKPVLFLVGGGTMAGALLLVPVHKAQKHIKQEYEKVRVTVSACEPTPCRDRLTIAYSDSRR